MLINLRDIKALLNRPSAKKVQTPAQEVEPNFSQVITQALAKIRAEDPEEARRTLLNEIIALESNDVSPDVTEPEVLAETVNKLVAEIAFKEARTRCLRVLSKVCRDSTTLRESCIVTHVEMGNKQKLGGIADFWAGKLEGQEVYVKVFRQHEGEKQEKIKEAFYRHIVRWKYIEHDNVLPFLGVSERPPPFGIISPWMPNGNILDYIGARQDVNRLLLLADAACGLEHLHSLDIVHGGVNPGNILIDGQGRARIGDYQIAGIITDPHVKEHCYTSTCRRGVARYMAPEQLNLNMFEGENDSAGKPADVHSFAMAAYQVLTGIKPYPRDTKDGPLTDNITKGTRPQRPQGGAEAEWLSDPIWKMMESCWALQIRSRPSIESVHRVFRHSATKVGNKVRRRKQRMGGGLIGKIRDLNCLGDPQPRQEAPLREAKGSHDGIYRPLR